MGKMYHFIKNEVRANLSQFNQIYLLMFLIPFLSSLVFSSSFSAAFQPDYQPDPISLQVDNQDRGHLAESLQQLEDSDLVVFEDQADFLLTIPEDFSHDPRQSQLTIQADQGASRAEGTILQSIISQWQQALVKNLSLAEAGGEDYAAIQADLKQKLAPFAASEVNLQAYRTDRTLTASQYQSIVNLFFLMYIAVFSFSQIATNPQYKGLNKRIQMAPLNAFQRQAYDILSNVLQQTGIALVYVLAWRWVDASTFTGNLFFYLAYYALFAFLFTSLMTLAQQVISGQVINVLSRAVFMVFFLLGVMPVEDFFGGQWGEFLATNPARRFLIQPFVDYLRQGEALAHLPQAVGMIVVALVFFALAIWIDYRQEVG